MLNLSGRVPRVKTRFLVIDQRGTFATSKAQSCVLRAERALVTSPQSIMDVIKHSPNRG